MLKIRQGNGCKMVLLSKLFEYFAAKIYAILAVLYLTLTVYDIMTSLGMMYARDICKCQRSFAMT